jgi:hypothetical protein
MYWFHYTGSLQSYLMIPLSNQLSLFIQVVTLWVQTTESGWKMKRGNLQQTASAWSWKGKYVKGKSKCGTVTTHNSKQLEPWNVCSTNYSLSRQWGCVKDLTGNCDAYDYFYAYCSLANIKLSNNKIKEYYFISQPVISFTASLVL